jgi:cellulose biosynthesis protein BcsQ
MSSYAFWNNKGGVGKSFLCFVAAAEYAHAHPETDVYVIDLCPQANVSEILLGGNLQSPTALNLLSSKTPRATVAGYLEARLNSPFRMISDVSPYVCELKEFNSQIPENLRLICGDNLLEIISEAIRQTSQLQIPFDAWKQVLSWIKDLTVALRLLSGERNALFLIDCNPSFAVYTQLGLVASEGLIIPFTSDDSSRRGIENVVALLYGISDPEATLYARISFSKRAKEEGLQVPKIQMFVSNRETMYDGKPAAAFTAIKTIIKRTVDGLHQKNRQIFANPKDLPSSNFIGIPDYHSACVVSATNGTPLYKLKPGPKTIDGAKDGVRVQLNPEPLQRYRKAMEQLVDYL